MRLLTFPILLLLCVSLNTTCFAFNLHVVDSMKNKLAHTSSDTGKVETLIALSSALEDNEPDTALNDAKEALRLARKMDWHKGRTGAFYHVGLMYDLKGDETNALIYMDSAIALALADNDLKVQRTIYNELGNIYSGMSNYPVALESYYKSLHLAYSLGDSFASDVYSNIGLVYQEEGNYSRALDNYYRAMKINESENDERGEAVSYCNIGIIYNKEGNDTKALEYHFKALRLDSAKKRDNEIAQDYSNIGDTYNALKEYATAIGYNYKGLDIAEKLGYKGICATASVSIAQSMISYFEEYKASDFVFNHGDNKVIIAHNALLDSALVYEKKALKINQGVERGLDDIYVYDGMGQIYNLQENAEMAIESYLNACSIADSIGALDEEITDAHQLAKLYRSKGKYQEEAQYLETALRLSDTLFYENQRRALSEQETQFEYDKKMLEQQKEREKEKALAEEQSKRQKIVIVGTLAGLAIVLVFMFILYKRFKITNQQRQIIEAQKKEVDKAYGKLNETHKELKDTHLQLQEKDKDLTDSIAYAQRIQNAILPSADYLKECLGDYFVLFKPRDVVSGDFYWCHKAGNKVIFAVADCTGHGVPGAFMSVIGNSLLNQVVIENKIYDTVSILTQLRNNLLKLLQQRGEEAVARDGMDIALAVWDKEINTLEYSGANNSLYLVRDNLTISSSPKMKLHFDKLVQILADKQPIGYQEGKMDVPFTAEKIELKKGDCIYISSDGYYDQFGGVKNKKFTSHGFRRLLVTISNRALKEQSDILNTNIEQWRGNYAQTDDICVLGLKIV